MSALTLEDDWLASAVGGRVQEFYSALGVVLPATGGSEASVRCFANPDGHNQGDRNPSCSVNVLSGLWVCHGCGQRGNAYQAALALGFNERRAAELARQHGLFLEKAPDPDVPRERLPDERKIRQWNDALLCSVLTHERGRNVIGVKLGPDMRFSEEERRLSAAMLRDLWRRKGWTTRAIARCGLGWDAASKRLIFTVRDKAAKKVGVLQYHPNPRAGEKKIRALTGSKRLFFPAPEMMSKRKPLYVVEGEACAVSVRSVGLQAVAIPGTQSWRPEFAQRLMPFQVIMLVDSDPQGRELGRKVERSLPRCKVVDLYPERKDGSDVGDLIAEAAQEDGIAQVRRLLERFV